VRPHKVNHLAGAEDVVDELEERLVLDLVVGEEERDALAVGAGHPVQQLQVFHQIVHIVRPQVHTQRQPVNRLELNSTSAL